MYLYIVLLFTKARLNGRRIHSLPCVVLQSKPPTNSFLQMKHTAVLGHYATDASSYLTQKSAILKRSGGTEASKTHYKARSSLKFTILCDSYLLFHENSRKTEASVSHATSTEIVSLLQECILFFYAKRIEKYQKSLNCSKLLVSRHLKSSVALRSHYNS